MVIKFKFNSRKTEYMIEDEYFFKFLNLLVNLNEGEEFSILGSFYNDYSLFKIKIILPFDDNLDFIDVDPNNKWDIVYFNEKEIRNAEVDILEIDYSSLKHEILFNIGDYIKIGK